MLNDGNRVKEIFLEAAEQPDEAAQSAYLARACGDDAGLRERVEALLRSHDPAGSFLGSPAVKPTDLNGATQELGVDPNATPDDDANGAEDLPFLSRSSRPDSLGRLGHYEMLQVLGKGGFGIVFRAFDETLQRVVAVKVMAPQIATLSPARKRFLREARSSAAVRHENVVQVYEVGERPLPYLAMEFVPGETLQQKLDRSGPLDVSEVLRIGRQVAEGLAAAHAMDLIHRDIKPANVLLEGGAQRRVKITDFGLARAADDASISQSGLIAGTPMYMAPEQALGHKLDQRADLFSLGSVLYQMVSGRPPFRAPSALAVLKRVAEESPRPIPEIIPETPAWLCDIIAKLHAKNPDERFQSAREIADVLADCEAQLKANAKLKDFSKIPVGKRPDSRRSVAKWVATMGLIVFSVTGLIAVVAGLFFRSPDLKPNDNPNSAVQSQPTPPVAVAKLESLPPTFTNSIGMEFVIVPKGKSWLSAGTDKLGFKEVESPEDFYLGEYEVTQEEWEKVMGKNPSFFSRMGGGTDAVKDISDADLKRFPVENVSLYDCWSFLQKLNEREKEPGWEYRLPNEEEWEYACRGGPMTDKSERAFSYYFAKPTNTLLPEQANFGKEKGLNRPCKVGAYEPNRLGLCDMHGNVSEWLSVSTFDQAFVGGSWSDDAGWGLLRAGVVRVGDMSTHSNSIGLRVARFPSGAPSPEVKTPPPAVAPFTDADVQRIAALPAEQQVEEVRKELVRRNPGFDGKIETKIERGVVTEFRIVTDQVTDIAPIRVFNSLRLLECSGTWTGKPNGLLGDLTPLEGMNLAGLNHLSLFSTKVTDASVANFKDCKNLTFLDLGATRVSDAGLIHFKDCKALQDLRLAGTKNVSDVGLAYFKDCKDLTHLHLGGTKVSDAGLANFKDCMNLTELLLFNTQVSDAGLAHFHDCKALTNLVLAGTKVGDLGLAYFKECKNLRYLHLDRTPVGDAGLAYFKGMPLTELYIDKTGITDLTPLQGMPLEDIRLTPKNITKGLDILRAMKSLKTIGVDWNQSWPAAEFWQRYDKGEFKE